MSNTLTVAFDADDTLWHNEDAFAAAEDQFNQLVSRWADAETAQTTLLEFERRHRVTYGYGVKSFALSQIAAACELSNDEITATELRTIVDVADELLSMPTVLIDDAREAVQAISDSYETMIITKGDLHHQLRRIHESGLDRFCFDVEVVAEKDVRTYRRILARHRLDPHHFVMVGNSVVSDVAPVLELGARAIHIPYEFTWALEMSDAEPEASDRWLRLDSIADLPSVIGAWA